MVMLPLSGVLADRFGPRPLAAAGMAAVALGTLPLTQLTATTPNWQLIATMLLRGLGIGASMMPAIAAGYRNLPPADSGRASTAISIFSRIGGTLGSAILAVILAQHLTSGHGSHSAATMAAGFGDAFWAAFVLAALGACAAVLLLPGRPSRVDPAAASSEQSELEPVVVDNGGVA